MKRLIILLISSHINFCVIYGQHDCAMPNVGATLNNEFSGIDFFSENICEPIILKCNFVIIRRDNGSGGFSSTSSLWTDWENAMNSHLANIVDPENCSSGYPLDAKIRVKFNVHTIDNTLAWDWYGETNRDNYNGTPNSYICPRVGNVWSDLENVMKDFESAHFGELNFFFVENGELIDLLETHIANGTRPQSKYIDRFEQNGNGIATGCSILPKAYNSTANENSYIIANRYSDYLIRKNFHDIWWPSLANESPETVWGWAFQLNTLMFLHELGHNIMNFYHDNSCKQLMSTDWQRSNHIPKVRLNDIHKNLATKDLHNAVDCNSLTDGSCGIIVKSNSVISAPMSVYGNLIIQDGITLTINSDVFLSEQSHIIVRPQAKLIVNGGKLTNGCGDFWQGVVVYGGNSDFDVKFMNNAVIENTAVAAVSMFAPESIPIIWGYGNGILHAENTTFNNVRRIVELMSWTPLPNSSYIRNCTQNGGRWSITNWNCQGVEVKDCIFNNITDHCIVSASGSFLIENNTFNSGMNDILFNNASAGIASIIKGNTFKGSNVGYNARGTTFAQNIIVNNRFQTSWLDVLNDGHNNFDLMRNEITGLFGAASFANGIGVADVDFNQFNTNLMALTVIDQNPDFNFFENCFNSSYSDVFINGTVSGIILSGFIGPANNCFTHDGSASSGIPSITGNPNPFYYIEPPGTDVDCRDAILAHPNVNRFQFGPSNLPEPNCGLGLTPIINGNDISACNSGNSYSTLPELINNLMMTITLVQQNTNLNSLEKQIQLSGLNKCLKKAKDQYFQDLIKLKEFVGARNIFAMEQTDDARIKVFSSYIFENNLSGAYNYLSQYNPVDEAMQDFKTIQYINLARLPLGPFYEPSNEEINTVQIIANKNHFTSAYAKALLYDLTGEVVSSELPEEITNGISPRSIKSGKTTPRLSYSPNPFSNELIVEIKGVSSGHFYIKDLMNNEVFYSKAELGRYLINTSNWKAGFYFIQLFADNKILITELVILLK